jgi:two-component system alkaline phosphatase synthesis response regulator PhoP
MANKSVLVADDDLISQNMLRTTLTSAGYSVFAASDGKEAIKLAKEELPDVIVLDIMMPGMDGGEVAEVLKSDSKTRKIPVIFLSSLITENDEKTSKNQEAATFLSKPYSREKLLNEVKKLILKQDG